MIFSLRAPWPHIWEVSLPLTPYLPSLHFPGCPGHVLASDWFSASSRHSDWLIASSHASLTIASI